MMNEKTQCNCPEVYESYAEGARGGQYPACRNCGKAIRPKHDDSHRYFYADLDSWCSCSQKAWPRTVVKHYDDCPLREGGIHEKEKDMMKDVNLLDFDVKAQKLGEFLGKKFQESVGLTKQKQDEEIDQICTAIGRVFLTFLPDTNFLECIPDKDYVSYEIKGDKGTYIINICALPVLKLCKIDIKRAEDELPESSDKLRVIISCYLDPNIKKYIPRTTVQSWGADISKIYGYMIDLLSHFDLEDTKETDGGGKPPEGEE